MPFPRLEILTLCETSKHFRVVLAGSEMFQFSRKVVTRDIPQTFKMLAKTPCGLGFGGHIISVHLLHEGHSKNAIPVPVGLQGVT